MFFLAIFPFKLTLYFASKPVSALDAGVAEGNFVFFTFVTTEVVPVSTIAGLSPNGHDINLHMFQLGHTFPLPQVGISNFFELDLLN